MVYKDTEKRNAYVREYRRKNPDKVKRWDENRSRNTPEGMRKFLDWQNERRREYKRKILELKKASNGCIECGWYEHPEILQYHHREKEAKSFVLSTGNLGTRAWKKILEEIEKCDLICPNCHFWKHFKETVRFTE